MKQSFQINLNDLSNEFPEPPNDTEFLSFPSTEQNLFKNGFEHEDDLGPWADTLTPKLGLSPKKIKHTQVHNQALNNSTSRTRDSLKNQFSIEDKGSLNKPLRFSKGGQNKGNDNSEGVINENEEMSALNKPQKASNRGSKRYTENSEVHPNEVEEKKHLKKLRKISRCENNEVSSSETGEKNLVNKPLKVTRLVPNRADENNEVLTSENEEKTQASKVKKISKGDVNEGSLADLEEKNAIFLKQSKRPSNNGIESNNDLVIGDSEGKLPLNKPAKLYKVIPSKIIDSDEGNTGENTKGNLLPPVPKIGVTDLSAHNINRKKIAQLQLIVGNMEDDINSARSHERSRQDTNISSPSNLILYKSSGRLNKEFVNKIMGSDSQEVNADTLGNYLKLYSHTERSIRDTKGISGTPKAEANYELSKTFFQKKEFGKKRKESRSINPALLAQKNKPKKVKDDPRAIYSKGIRIVGVQKNPSKLAKINPHKEDKSEKEKEKRVQDDLKDKLHVLKKIRNISHAYSKALPSIDEQKTMERVGRGDRGEKGEKREIRDMSADNESRERRSSSPLMSTNYYTEQDYVKSEVIQAPKTQDTENQGESSRSYIFPVFGMSPGVKKSFNSARMTNRNVQLYEELRKASLQKDKTEIIALGPDNKKLAIKLDTNDMDEAAEKLKQIISLKNRSVSNFGLTQPGLFRLDKLDKEVTIGQDFFTKSYNPQQWKIIDSKLSTPRVEADDPQVLQSKGELQPSTVLVNNKTKRTTKKSNFEVQAALFQEKTVQKNIKTLKT